jgi:DNA polymerase epsilon subunit 1
VLMVVMVVMVQVEDVVNYADVKGEIMDRLAALRDDPVREEEPLIYHLDVGAMYPNIILTNRLQPCSIKAASDCAACDFNQEKNGCKRPMRWVWRGEHTPAKRQEYELILTQLAYESVKGQAFHELAPVEQARRVRERLNKYSQTVYKKTKCTSEETRVDTVCMRENPFYVNTVRAFRDRRYEYKVLSKQCKQAKAAAEEKGDAVARKVGSRIDSF